MTKSDKVETDKRIETVRQLVLTGMNHTRLVNDVAVSWSVSTRQGWRYVASAQARILASNVVNREYLLAEHVSLRRSLRERTRKTGDLRAELAVVQDEAKLLGLYPTEKHEIAHTWREEAKSAGIDADALVSEVFSKVPSDPGASAE